MTVKGHAQSAEYGKDLVCASASTLAYTLAQVVTDKCRDKFSYINPPKIILKSGFAEVECVPEVESLHDMRTIFNTIETGFRMLQNSYPEYVSLKGFE